MAEESSGQYLTAGDVARVLQVSVHTVRRWFSEGRLPGRKAGKGWRTTQRALDEFVETGNTDS